MSAHADAIRLQLGRGPQPVRQLVENLKLSQPTISRAINALGDEIVRIESGRTIHYALRDARRGIGEIAIYRVSAEGTIQTLGTLIPVRPDGFVMQQSDGHTLHSDSLPWWLFDMRPQGYLGRAYAARHAAALGLPGQLTEWNDTHALRALLAQGHDALGNLLLGDVARERFLSARYQPLTEADKAGAYGQLAAEAARGEIPGSSAGGEQPKFVTYAQTANGPRHLIVKFSLPEDNPITERWRDLLLAEHLALDTLNRAGIAAVHTQVKDFGNQRFLEIERFDREGELGRHALVSLRALDAEFVGAGAAGWLTIANALAKAGQITPKAAAGAALLQAFGDLIGNTDMHAGNLSFVSDHGRPYDLAPAYDMLPMGFQPRSSGALPTELGGLTPQAGIEAETWQRACQAARHYLNSLHHESRFSAAFQPCIAALARHIETAAEKIARLG